MRLVTPVCLSLRFPFLFAVFLAGVFSCGTLAQAQVQSEAQVMPPDRKFLFLEDEYLKLTRQQKRKEIKARREQVKARAKSIEGLPFDISAGTISFDSTNNKVIAKDNVLIGHSLGIIEADEGLFNVETNEVELKKDIRITEVTRDVLAQEARMNISTGELDVHDTEIFLEEGGYNLKADRIRRSPEDKYIMDNAQLTTCKCAKEDNCTPWSLVGDTAEITPNGYGEIWNSTLNMYGVPVFYLPYMFFPVKTERQTGLLPASVGYGRRSGFELELPFFWAINNSTDATITPVMESRVRVGSMTEYRKVFSKTHRIELGATYLNEAARGDKLLGTNLSGLADPTIDTHRIAGYVDQFASFELSEQPFQVILDGNYVGDDLLLREFEIDKIGRYNSRFVTSKAALRSTFLDRYALDLSTEYNQAMVVDDDMVLQQMPQFLLKGLNSFKPFGDNTLGAKLQLSSEFSAVRFDRKASFDGSRAELYEVLKLPFHYRNYFDATMSGDVRMSSYSLANREVLADDGSVESLLSSNSDRVVPGFSSKVSTVVEKVFNASEDGALRRLGELGTISRTQKLVRFKHTVEPFVKYRYVPSVDQSDNPQFDTRDHLAQRNLVAYGVVQRLFSRYEPRDEFVYGIEEATPEVSDIASWRQDRVIDRKFGFGTDVIEADEYVPMRRGSVREVMNLVLQQSYDINYDSTYKNASDAELLNGDSAFSDVSAKLTFRPNEYLGLKTQTDYNVDDLEVSSYSVESQIEDKRGDEVRSRFRFVENSISQIETSMQLNINKRLKLGYYSRFDEQESKFLEHKAGVRFVSACDCWFFDVDVSDRLNPDETTFSFTVTLVGLGAFGNSFFELNRDDDRTDS